MLECTKIEVAAGEHVILFLERVRNDTRAQGTSLCACHNDLSIIVHPESRLSDLYFQWALEDAWLTDEDKRRLTPA